MNNQDYISMFAFMPEPHKKMIAEMIQQIRAEDKVKADAELASLRNLIFQDQDLERRFMALQEENAELRRRLDVIRAALQEEPTNA